MLRLGALDAAKEATLGRGGVADVGLLLLVDLADVDELLDRAGRDHPVDVDVARLTPAIGAVHGLEVVRRVPWTVSQIDERERTVGIEDDDLVGGGQIESDAAGHGRDEEGEDAGVGVELVAETEPLVLRNAAVEVLEVRVVLLEPLADRPEHAYRAGEDEDLVPVGAPLVEEVVEDRPLAAQGPAG